MRLSSAVLISLLLNHRVVISDGSFLREKILLNEENILEQFFAEGELYLDKYETRHIMVVGASDDQFDQIKPLLKAFPFFIGEDVKTFCVTKQFAPHTLILQFLASLDEDYIIKVMKSLFYCRKNRTYFIFEGVAVKRVDIESMFDIASKQVATAILLIHRSEKSLKLYNYEIAADCTGKANLASEWVPGVNVTWLVESPTNLVYECPIPIGAKHHPPWMNLVKDAKGVDRIIGGLEGNIISSIARVLNFTYHVQDFDNSDQDESDETVRIVSSCATGKTIIGIAKIRPTDSVIKAIDLSRAYAQEHIVWCVPRITQWKRSILTSEFFWSAWVLIGLTFLASFVVEKIVRNKHHLNRGNANKSESSSIILDLIGATLGNPIIYHPLSIGCKLLLIIYIFYSMVITTAYKTSLSSILMVDNGESSIVNLQVVIDANLTVGGDMARLSILKDQIEEDELIPELIKRYVIETNISKALRRVSYDKNFAYLTSTTDLAYHRDLLANAGEFVSFDVLKEYVLSYGTVIVCPKSSFFIDQINRVTQHLDDAGLLHYWLRNNYKQQRWNSNKAKSSEIMNTEENLHKFTRENFYRIFYIYCLALTPCTLVFLGELLVHKFKFRAGIRRVKNFRRSKVKPF